MTSDPLAELSQAGVSIWLDDLSRPLLASGRLADLAAHDHVVGVTSNPTIFAKAITGGDAYTAQLQDLARRGVSVGEALRALTTFDVRWACDVFHATYVASDRVDGRVSIEVDPRLAHDTAATVAEARALWWLVDRPNLFIKIPAAQQGLPAIEACLAEGISINVTLIFSLDRYDAVMEAFLAGLERARQAGHDLSSIASVASFFVSRVDTEVERAAGQDRHGGGGPAARPGGHRERAARLRALRAGVQLGPVGRAARGGCPATAPAVGVHVGQGPGLPGHPVRDWPGRAGRGQHDAGSHAACGGRARRGPGGLGAWVLPRGGRGAQPAPGHRPGLHRDRPGPGGRRGAQVRRQLGSS